MGLQEGFCSSIFAASVVCCPLTLSLPHKSSSLALLGKERVGAPTGHRGRQGSGRATIRVSVFSMLLEPVRRRPDELELNAIFVRVPFPSVNANPELQAIRMTS